MPARFFLILIEGLRDGAPWLLFVFTAITAGTLTYDTGGVAPPAWLLAGVPVFLLLGSLEPTLVVLVCAEAGVVWVGADPWYFGCGIVIATAVAYVRLLEHRGESSTLVATIGGIALLAAVVVLPFWHPYIFGPAYAALVLAAFGMEILLPSHAHARPRLPYLLGGVWVFGYLMLVQVMLLVFCRKVLRFSKRRVRRLGGRGMRTLFGFFPYGRFDRDDIKPLDQPCVVVSNHQSSVDIPIILGLPGDVRLTLSERVWNAPWLGISAQALGHIVTDEDVLERCRKVMKEGASVHFFPEGTRSIDGYPARFHRGAFELAVQLQVPVVPVVLCDTRTCVPRDAYWVEYFHMGVRMLDPVPPGDDSRALQKHVQELIREEFLQKLRRINTQKQMRRKVLRLYRYMGWRAYFGVREELSDPDLRTKHCGYGARVHWQSERSPGEQFTATDPDPHKLAIAQRSAMGKPRVTFEAPQQKDS